MKIQRKKYKVYVNKEILYTYVLYVYIHFDILVYTTTTTTLQ